MFQCVLCGNMPLSILLQTLATSFEIFVSGQSPDKAVPPLCFILVVAFIFDWMAWTTAATLQQSERLSRSEVLVVKLLEGMHDAVVHLTLDLVVSRPTTSLQGL